MGDALAYNCNGEKIMNNRQQAASPWVARAIWAQVALLVYFELSEWVNVFPWNDIRKGNGQEGLDIGLGIFTMLAILATWKRWRWAIWVASAFHAIWLGLQIQTWWWNYVFGASPAWKKTWARVFSQTTRILPVVGDHLPPDACHFVLQLLILAALIACVAAAWSLHPRAPILEQERLRAGSS